MCLDDIIVCLSSFEDHKAHLPTVLDFLEFSGVKLRFSKSKFFHTEVHRLGQVIKQDSLEIAPDMNGSFYKATTPCKVKGVRSFLGFYYVYR